MVPPPAWLPGRPAALPAGCMAVWLPGRLAAWPVGWLPGWPAGRSPVRRPDFQVPGCSPEPIAFPLRKQKIQDRWHPNQGSPPEDQNQREGEGERGRQRKSERAREGEMLQSTVFSHKIQWSRSQFRSQACPEDRGGTQLIEQKCRVIADQHRGSSFKKL